MQLGHSGGRAEQTLCSRLWCRRRDPGLPAPGGPDAGPMGRQTAIVHGGRTQTEREGLDLSCLGQSPCHLSQVWVLQEKNDETIPSLSRPWEFFLFLFFQDLQGISGLGGSLGAWMGFIILPRSEHKRFSLDILRKETHFCSRGWAQERACEFRHRTKTP